MENSFVGYASLKGNPLYILLHMPMIQEEQGFYNLKLKKYKFKISSIWLKCDEL